MYHGKLVGLATKIIYEISQAYREMWTFRFYIYSIRKEQDQISIPQPKNALA